MVHTVTLFSCTHVASMCTVHTTAAINHQPVCVHTVSEKYVQLVKRLLTNKRHTVSVHYPAVQNCLYVTQSERKYSAAPSFCLPLSVLVSLTGNINVEKSGPSWHCIQILSGGESLVSSWISAGNLGRCWARIKCSWLPVISRLLASLAQLPNHIAPLPRRLSTCCELKCTSLHETSIKHHRNDTN